MRLHEYSDREISLMMRESINRLFTSNPLSIADMEHMYGEYRTRELVTTIAPHKESARVHGAPSNVCGCGAPLDDHLFGKKGVVRCPVGA